MSQINFSENGDAPVYRKPRADLYTVMLVLALVALILGTICLWAEMDDYQYKIKGASLIHRNRGAAMATDVADAATTLGLGPQCV